MKSKLILLSALALSISITSCKKEPGPDGAQGPQGPGGPVLTGSLKGFVGHYDVSGAKITTDLAGDSVLIDGTTQVSVTDASGLYTFSGITTGVYNLTVKRAGYGTNKVQNVQFTGGGDTYRNSNISKIPTTTITTLLAYDTIINAVNYIRVRGIVPPSPSGQTVVIFTGYPGSTIVNSSSANQITSVTQAINPNVTSFFKNILTTDFYDLGYVSGNTAYFAAYIVGGNTNASSYNDLTNNKTIYTALSSSYLQVNAPVQ